MAGFGIIAKLGVDATSMKRGLNDMADKTKSFGSKVAGVMKGAAIAVGAAFAGMAIAGTKEFVDFEKQITEVFTLIPKASTEMRDSLEADIRALASGMGVDLTDATSALYNAISAGIPEGNAVDFLATATKTAVGGVASLEDSVAALTTVINGYGMEATDAEKVSDILFTTVKKGVTNMTELAANIGKVTPVAADLGIEFKEVGAMFSTMTKIFGAGKTAEVGTAIKSMLSEMSKEGMRAFDNFVEVSGTTFPKFVKAGGTVADALKMMKKSAEANDKSLKDMFRGVESGNAALALASNEFKDLDSNMSAFQDTAGATETAFQAMEKTASRNWDKMKAKFKDLRLTLGEIFLPLLNMALPAMTAAMDGAINVIKGMVKWVRDSDINWGALLKTMKVIAATFLAYKLTVIALSIKTAFLVVKTAAQAAITGVATAAQWALNVAMSANVIGLVVALFVGLVAVIYSFVDANAAAAKQQKETREEAKKFFDQMDKDTEKLEDDTISLIKQTKNYEKQLADLRKEKELLDAGNTQAQTDLELAKSKLDTDRDALQVQKDAIAEAEALGVKMKNNGAILLANATSEVDKAEKTSIIKKAIADNELLIAGHRKESARLTLEIEKGSRNIARIVDQVKKDEESRVKNWKAALSIMKEVQDAHNLSKTDLGQVKLLTEDLVDLEQQKADILKAIKEGRQGEVDSVKELAKVEKEILETQEKIEKKLLSKLNKVRNEEIDARKDIIKELQKEEKLQAKIAEKAKEAADEAERKLDAAKGAVEAAQKAIDDAVEEGGRRKVRVADKFDVLAGRAENVGEEIVTRQRSQRDITNEFKKLEAAGQLPAGVRTRGQFARHLRDKDKEEEQRLKDANQALKDAEAAKAKADAKAKDEADKLKKIQDDQKAEEEKILQLRDDIADKEKKNLKDLVAEREKLQAVLKEWRNLAQGAKPAIEPNLKDIADGLGKSVADALTVAATAAREALTMPEGAFQSSDGKWYDADGNEIDPTKPQAGVEIELPDEEAGDNEAALEELQDANTNLFDIKEALEGKFVNQ